MNSPPLLLKKILHACCASGNIENWVDNYNFEELAWKIPGIRIYGSVHLNMKLSGIFYGWWIVGACFLIAMYVGGVVFYGFTAIFEPIAQEFGWSYAQISFAASLRGLETGIMAPLVGMLADRWGPRRLIFFGGVITALGLVLLSYTTSLGMFYGAFILIALGISGASLTVLMTAVATWFRKKVGLASGIAVSGFGAGGLLVPVIVWLIEMYGWRMAMTILAATVLVVALPLSFMFRHKPEQYGYLPDGEAPGAVAADRSLAPAQTDEVNIGRLQALKSSTFWRLTLAFTCHVMLLSATVTHVMPYLSSIGVDRARSSLVATAIPLMSIGGRLGIGWLGDRLNRRKVAAGAFAMVVIGLLFFGYVSTAGAWWLVPFLLFFGIGYGGTNVMRPALAREYFGRINFGAVFGLIVGLSMLGGVAGPPLAGWVFDNWGSYQGIWFVFAGLALVGLISLLSMPPVRTSSMLADKS